MVRHFSLIQYSCYRQDGKEIDDICEKAADELADASSENDIKTYLEVLRKLSRILYPSHYISKIYFSLMFLSAIFHF